MDIIRKLILNFVMRNCHHAQTLKDGTKVVRMSKEFHDWVYSEGYELWKKKIEIK